MVSEANFGLFDFGEGGRVGERGVKIAVCRHEIQCFDFVGDEIAKRGSFDEVATVNVVDNPIANVVKS